MERASNRAPEPPYLKVGGHGAASVTARVRGKSQPGLFLPGEARSMVLSSILLSLPTLQMSQSLFRWEERQLIVVATFRTYFSPAGKSTYFSLQSAPIWGYINPIAPALLPSPLDSPYPSSCRHHTQPNRPLRRPPPSPSLHPFNITATLNPIDHVGAVAPSPRTFSRRDRRAPPRQRVVEEDVGLLRKGQG